MDVKDLSDKSYFLTLSSNHLYYKSLLVSLNKYFLYVIEIHIYIDINVQIYK